MSTKCFGEYEVIVVGAGPGGLMAAIAAGRMGKKTLLLENSAYLGGLAASGLPFLAFLDRTGRQVVGGIPQELVDRLKDVDGTLGHVKCPIHNSTTPVNHYWVRIVASEMCDEAGVDFILSTDILSVDVDNGRIRGLAFIAKGLKYTVAAKIIIDATGDGTVIHQAGAKYEIGGPDRRCQPASMVFSIGNVDMEEFKQYIIAHPETFKLPDSYGVSYSLDYFLDNCPGFYFTGFGEFIEKARENGEFTITRDRVILQTQPNKGEILVNASRLLNADPTDPISFSRQEVEGNRQIRMFMNFFRKYCPGFKNAFLANIHGGVGVRESRRMVGIKTMGKEYLDEKLVPDDTIALAGYNIDIHDNKDVNKGKGLYLQPVEHAVGIPYGCLVSENIDGLLASGRLISIDPYVFGLTRIIGTCLAVGQAAGTAAAQSIEDNVSPSRLDINKLRSILRKNGAIIE